MGDSGPSFGCVASKNSAEVVEVACWALPGAIFPLHITHFVSNILVDPSLFEKGREIPLNQFVAYAADEASTVEGGRTVCCES